MRISDNEIKKVLSNPDVAKEIDQIGQENQLREDQPLIEQLTQEIIEMPDREEMIAELKAKIEAGEYNPTGDEIADAMIRRTIADRIR
ncbi:MAG TPA: flagellar biosynthesis anti-sigma factor FlgM [Fimbriimonadaceae bacterium]|jgi:anti-sigma28 factor (negative regulator of flagellin synthesis)|nr:flagellar biosynthesis anti-sigma factor FlgM [Fimbriimonadaceae bacterium]